MQTQTIDIDGKPVFLRLWGDPSLPKLLLLHGFPEYGGAWTELAERLCHRFYCIAPDQRGFGQSHAPAEVSDYATSKLVQEMAQLIGTEPLTVLGHDWGAAVAYGLAMFRPELVDRLIVMNGVHPVPFQRALAAGGAQSAASQYILYLRKTGVEAALAKDRYAKLRGLFAAHMDMSWLSGARLDAYVAEWDRPGRLRGMLNWYRASPLAVAAPGEVLPNPIELPTERLQVRCPHLLIWGADDQALLPESTQGLEDFARDLTRIEITGADHWLHHQKPDEVADAILSWCDTHSA